MKSELFHIGSFTVYGYGMMIGLGVISAYLIAEYRARKLKIDNEHIFALTIWALVGGMVGAKLLYYITIWKEVISNPKLLLDISDGFVVYGGIIAGILTVWIYCRVKKLNFASYFDLLIPEVAFAQGFGRIGCLLAGCCYGRETTGPLGIIFHESHFAPNGISLVPTQIISSGLNFANFFFLIWFAKRKKGDGQVAGMYLILYSIGRFILEFFRGDLERGSVGSLSTSQFISIFILVAGYVVFWLAGRKKKGLAE